MFKFLVYGDQNKEQSSKRTEKTVVSSKNERHKRSQTVMRNSEHENQSSQLPEKSHSFFDFFTNQNKDEAQQLKDDTSDIRIGQS